MALFLAPMSCWRYFTHLVVGVWVAAYFWCLWAWTYVAWYGY